MENPSNIQPDQVIVVEGDAGFVPKAEPSDAGKVLGVVNASGDVGWVEASGGQLTQVQSDWAETDPAQVSYIDNKPDLSVYATSSAVDTALAGKQDTISDLSDIRSGASAGATAVQPSALDSYATTSAMNTALASKQDTISDLSDIRAGAAKGDTAVQPAALNDYATTAAMNTALAGKQDVINDLADIRSGASAGATAVQPSALDSYATTSAMNTALAGKQDVISDLSDIRAGASAGATAVQPAALEDYATVSAMNSALAGKQNTISDLDTIRAGAALGATAAQPSDLPSSDELVPSATSGDSGKVLTVDAQGEPSWQTPAGGSDVVTANGSFKLGGSVPVKVNYTGSQEYERGSLQLVNTFAAPGNYAVAVFEVVGAHHIDFDTYGSATVTINEAMDIAGSGNSDFAISFLQSDSNWYNNGQIYRGSATVTDGKIVAQSLLFGSVSQYDTGPYLGVGVKVTNSPYESEKIDAVVQQLANGAVSISNWPKEQITVTTIPNIPASTSADENKVLTVDSNGDAIWQNVPTPSVDEVPDVTSSDDGKVLTAAYSGGTGSYSWQPASGGGGTVDQTYNASSTNAQSGTAVAGALATVNQVPASTSSDEDKVLTVNSSGNPVWAAASTPYSKPLVAGANITITDGANDVTIAATNTVPASTPADEDKVLTVNSSGEPVWAAAQGGGGSGGDSEFPYNPGYLDYGDNTMVVRFGDTSYDPTTAPSASNFVSITALSTPGVYQYSLVRSSSTLEWSFANEWNNFSTNPVDVLYFNSSSAYDQYYRQLFRGCTGLRSIWNFRGIYSDLSYWCQNCTNLQIFSSNAKDRYETEASSGSFSYELESYFIKLSDTNTAYCMFENCPSLRRVDTLLYFDGMSGDASGVCRNSKLLEVGPAIGGCLSTMSTAFSNCFSLVRLYNLEDFPALMLVYPSIYAAPSETATVSNAFANCRSLKDVSGLRLDKCAVSNLSSIFEHCSGLREMNCVLYLYSGGCDADRAFYDCTELTVVPCMDYKAITSATAMFYGDSKLLDVTELNGLANMCTNVNSLLSGSYNIVKGVDTLYSALSSSQTISSHADTFMDAGAYAWNNQLSQIPSSWGGTGA